VTGFLSVQWLVLCCLRGNGVGQQRWLDLHKKVAVYKYE
jgi:hypothetical protein